MVEPMRSLGHLSGCQEFTLVKLGSVEMAAVRTSYVWNGRTENVEKENGDAIRIVSLREARGFRGTER